MEGLAMVRKKSQRDNSRNSKSSRSDPRIRYRNYQGPEDHALVANLCQVYWDTLGLDYITLPDEIERSFKYLEHFNPHLNVKIAENEEHLLGYALVHWFQESDGNRIYRHIIRVLPNGWQEPILEELLRFAERRLYQLARRHPSHLPKYYATGVANSDPDQMNFLRRHGYHPVRYFFEMARPLSLPIADLQLPEGIELRQAKPQEYRTILAALDEAFRDHWGHVPLSESEIQWWMESPQFQPHLWKVAWDGDEVVGMVLNFIDENENKRFKRKRGYTEDICVRQPWRRRGIARTLIAQSLKELIARGMDEAALGVDTNNPNGALSLYQSLGYDVIKQHTSLRKELGR